ncbi:ras-related GTP-binding protein A-like [Rhopalosiphum maidis]|uniref:ras-related GTP-binding protein A-like n=1 Tax=Rhopalosiphum maidis TaxID=43146 RepID=UPI000F004363|nr:ras-related GTP-binding protein A-like [Rhopalosiphum maidis]
MEALKGAAVEYTSDGEISEQMSGTVTHSLRKLGKRKVNILIMGRGSSGKTSMRSIIFDNFEPIDTKRLCATNEVETTHVPFLGHMLFNIKDCGGQDKFVNNYFDHKRKHLFRNIDVFVYLFEVNNRDNEFATDLKHFKSLLSAICEGSPFVNVFCLMHKMDLIKPDQREKLFKDRENELINISKPVKISCFMTSIWDESLYGINIKCSDIENTLKSFAEEMECDEVILFERTTSLVIAKYLRVPHNDVNRTQKVSKIIKIFKAKLDRYRISHDMFEIRHSRLTIFIHKLTFDTFLMVVTSHTTTKLIPFNIKSLKTHFSKLLQDSCQQPETSNHL